jgi:hypothetical protein
MQALIDRDYCLRHPAKIIRLFGFGVYLGMLLDRRKTLLERVVEKYRAHGVAAPGAIGNAYKCSALFEFRVARISAAMARQFADQPAAAALFGELSDEEMEHGRVMLTCLFQVSVGPTLDFLPSVRDPEVRDALKRLRAIERRVPEMTLEEALTTTAGLERGEVNVIFGRLLGQVDKAQLALFAQQLTGTQNHSESVPRRIAELSCP